MKQTILFLTLSDNADIVQINEEDTAMDHYTTKNFMLTESIGFRLVKARNVVVAEMDAALKDLDINGQQMGILLSLKQGVASTPFELSKLLGIDTGLMTRMLDKLESKGLLKRSRDPQDRRVVNLTLTAEGQKTSARIPEVAPHVLNARLRKFTKAEFAELDRLLRKFTGD
ncbi:DNA-binding MarR family transcriptional regulator [Paraburkholderia sp. Cpub6]|nr:DNA-binding MarR family transcriptional regulator [Paraburkholderia sp. Cpub6]